MTMSLLTMCRVSFNIDLIKNSTVLPEAIKVFFMNNKSSSRNGRSKIAINLCATFNNNDLSENSITAASYRSCCPTMHKYVLHQYWTIFLASAATAAAAAAAISI